MFAKKKSLFQVSLSLTVFLVLLGNVFFQSLPAQAGNAYYVGKNGSDANPGTEAQPFLTIQKAANVAQAGDTVYVKAGTYNEEVTAVNSGTAGNLITFQRYNTDTVVVKPGANEVGFNFNRKNYIKLDGFEFSGGTRGIYNTDSDYATQGLVISNNYVHDTGEDGMYLRGINQSLISQNKVINAGAPGYGSCIVVGGDDNVIEYNQVSNPGDEDGIKMWGSNTVIRGNYIRWINGTGHSDGVQIQSGKNIILENNIIENARTQALMAKSTSDPSGGLEGLIVRGNVIYMTEDFPEAGTIRLNIHSAPNSKIYNNTVHGGAMGLRFTDGSYGEVKNNIFFGNDSDNGVDPAESSVDYNIYWGDRQGTPAQNGDNGAHSFRADPKFLDPASHNFYLQSGSPAIDAGTSDGTPTTDRDGNFRYDKPDTSNTGGGAYPYYDIGAYEYGGTGGSPPFTSKPIERLWGQTSIDTANAISQTGFSSGSKVVLVARNDYFTDALAGGPLAKYVSYKYGTQAPILLSNPNNLTNETRAEIQRLGPERIYMLGGPGALGFGVEDALRATPGVKSVVRLWGQTAYGTALAIKAEMAQISGEKGSPAPITAIITTGENFPDSLVISAPAASKNMPILLVKPFAGEPPQETKLALAGITQTIIVGGPGAVHPNLEKWLNDNGHPVQKRLWGLSEYDTAIDVASTGSSIFNFNRTNTIITRGDYFTDALAGGPLAVRWGLAPIILVKPDSVPHVTNLWLNGYKSQIMKVYILGGSGAVSEAVKTDIAGIIM